ncbi:hypothetical protein OOT46_12605 [Aquabacterium sp. A7-Y]|uniref:hypothetical protein n=1 Tax=Aquabacterium sp. A7-Y TaxID=1349605 RepID=UPI00223E6745|nr:hypothetical protein [Aquabacterium sp. A7-Y]MCW7538684.1 hypothetical protein [Aquabacterium sp. A7-Y]
MSTVQSQQLQRRESSTGEVQHAPVELLQLVDFKWMMAGQGWWVDLTRLQRDSAYAVGCLRSALSSNCHPLRRCATDLQACWEPAALVS